MSIFHNSALIGASGQGGYQIKQSLRFNSADSTVLSLAASTSNTSTKFTFSFWMKPAKIGGATGDVGIWRVDGPNSSESAIQIGYNWNAIGDAKIGCYWHQTGTSNNYNGGATNAVYRDPSSWYHFVIAIDTTQASGPDRFKVYSNGVLQDRTFDTSNYIPQNYAAQFNAYTQKIGEGANFYLSEFYLIRDQALTPSSFGETDTITGAWIPKKYAAAHGSKDIYFKFESSGVGTDSSGNGNNFTATGFSTSGTGTDVMSDTPTNNFATVNPLHPSGSTGFSDGNLRNTFSDWHYDKEVEATFYIPNSGKYYFEVQATGGNSQNISGQERTYLFGLQPAGKDGLTELVGWYASASTSLYVGNGTATTASGTPLLNNTVVMCAVDADTGKVWMGKDGSWYDTATSTNGNPSSGTNQSATLTANTAYVPSAGSGCDPGTTSSIVWNFGQRAFAYTPPTNFRALCTATLPEPTIKKGGAHFNTVTYTGTGATQTVTGVGFQPDFVWAKSRTNAYSHQLYDAIRGAGKSLVSNLTIAENTVTYLNAFTSNGFTLDGDAGINASGASHVAWNWKANGAGSSNTAGSITSTVSANATAGFSIVTYTGNGTNPSSVGHGLGVPLKMYIIKSRTEGSTYWPVWHWSLGASDQTLYLNTTTGASASGSFGAAPSSTVFNVNQSGPSGATNTLNQNYVAYCFSEVAGYSKFGSYTGNGSSDGPFVFCGFRPAWIMMKSYTNAGEWYVKDTRRDPYNPAAYVLKANLADQDANNSGFYEADILSNGFKLRTSNTSINQSSQTYIFAAFAENPFKYANAR